MTEAEKAYQYFVIAVPENEEQAKAYFWARKALQPTLTPPNEWVSVEERLPEGHVQVLMWSAKWNIAEAGSYYNKHFWVYSEIGDGYIAEDITYWMPLPAPPGKDNNVPTKAQNEPLTCDGCISLGNSYGPCMNCIRSRLRRDMYRRPPEGEEDT